MNVLYIIGYIIQILQEFVFRNYLTKSMCFDRKTKAKYLLYIHFENTSDLNRKKNIFMPIWTYDQHCNTIQHDRFGDWSVIVARRCLSTKIRKHVDENWFSRNLGVLKYCICES